MFRPVATIVLTKQRKRSLCLVHQQQDILFLLELSKVLKPLWVGKPVGGHIWGHVSPVQHTDTETGNTKQPSKWSGFSCVHSCRASSGFRVS